jgi:predicted alpha/beta superfamily hydrolase
MRRIALLLCLISTVAIAQKPLVNHHALAYEIKSEINKTTYVLGVSVPKDYNPKKKYPVLYMLDGYYASEIAHGAHKSLKFYDEIEDIILVTIQGTAVENKTWFTQRWSELTFTKFPAYDSTTSVMEGIPAPGLKSGEGERFLNVIKNEIIPFIEKTYPTNGHRGLAGHSLGGLFTANVLFHSPELFDHYGINSPSFVDWNQNDILLVEKKFASTHKSLPVKVFLSYGQLEDEEGIQNMKNIEKLFKSHYPDMEIKLVIFDDEGHASVIPAMISRSMRYLYERKMK